MRAWRKLTGIVAVMLLASSFLAGGALAATPSWEMVVTPLPLEVAPGEITGYRVVIRNTGTSNISQVYLTNAVQTKDGLTSADPYAILPIAYVATSQGQCDPVDVTPPIDPVDLACALGAIRAGRSATVTVAYQTDVTWERLQVILEANTTGVAGDNPGSSHGDVLQGVGLTPLNDSANFAGRFVTSGLQVVFDDQTLSSTNQQTTLVNAPAVGIGVTVADGMPASWCAPACTSESSEVHVNIGEPYPNGFRVDIQLFKNLVSGSITTVYHQLDGDGGTIETITNTCPKNGDPNASQMPCFRVKNLPGGNALVTIWNTVNGKYGM